MAFKPIGTPKAFIVHHSAGRGDVQGVLNTLRQRGLGVQYVMDRDGKIYETGGAGVSQMRPGSGVGAGLSNANTVGMEVIAKDDSDVTPAQVAAAREFVKATYPGVPVYGHGQVNPGHKQASEGMTIVNAINDKAPQQGPPASAQISPEQYRRAFLDSIAQGESPGYDVMYGGSKFSDFSRHPHQSQTANGVTSDAAGRYQFLGSTWDEQQKKYGYKDFSQQTQDLAAWNYANDIFKTKTGGDLQAALSSNDPGQINAAASILNQTWSSLPGGKEQSKGYGNKTFYDVYSGHLGSAPPVDAPAGADTPVAADDSGPPVTNQYALPGYEKQQPKNWMQAFGQGLVASAAQPLPQAQRSRAAMPAAVLAPEQQPLAPIASVDPNRRAQLAQLMAQLNSGKLG